jgi:hypothetical protein
MRHWRILYLQIIQPYQSERFLEMLFRNWIVRLASVLTLGFCSGVMSAENESLTIPDHPKWKAECGSCHVVYPPQLLTEGGWQRLVAELDTHFGVSATLNNKDNQEILDFLKRNSGSGWNGMSSESGIRITDTPWFIRKHRKVPNKIWFDTTSVKSPSNCTACHVDAEHGDWSAKSVRIPIPASNNKPDI